MDEKARGGLEREVVVAASLACAAAAKTLVTLEDWVEVEGGFLEGSRVD